MLTDGKDNYVYIVEGDPEARLATVRRIEVPLLIFSTMVLVIVCCVGWVEPPEGRRPSVLLGYCLVTWLTIVAITYLVVPRCVGKTYVLIGGDFIASPLAGFVKGMTIAKYKYITRVSLDISGDRITGATIWARGLPLRVRHVKEPAIVIRAVLEQAGDHVKWYRSWRPFVRLRREDVRTMIDKAGAPAFDHLLPSSATYARADDLFSRDRPAEARTDKRGLISRLFRPGPPRTVNAVSSRLPTRVDRYIHAMLVQMFLKGPTTRILKRSEQLLPLTLGSETVPPPPLEEVLNSLKSRCGLDVHRSRGPTDGTIEIAIQEAPCRVLCRFYDCSDACCQIWLETVVE